jgi:hypothetical protein
MDALFVSRLPQSGLLKGWQDGTNNLVRGVGWRLTTRQPDSRDWDMAGSSGSGADVQVV